MFNRTAEYLAHGGRSLGPLAKLQPEQRMRVEKSSKKVGKVLGEMPVIDIIPASPGAGNGIATKAKKSGKSKRAPPAPVLRIKLTPLRRTSTLVSLDLASASTGSTRRARKPVPSLHLGLSPFRASQARTPQGFIFLSPLSPLSPFSPIETSDMREQRYHGLRRLAHPRALRDTIVEELPSFAQAVEQVGNLDSYLDLYRIGAKDRRDSDTFTRMTNLDTAYTACTNATDAEAAYTGCIACTPASVGPRRRSVSFSHAERRSNFSSGSVTPIARTSFIVPHTASVCSFKDQPARYTLVINVPSPHTPTACIPFTSSTASTARISRAYTIVMNVPQNVKRDTLPETPADDSAPLQKQQKEARARAALLTAMDQPAPALISPVPQADPRGPYWVRQSYRISTVHGYVRWTHSYSRRSGVRVPPTPRTVRRERRQGWGGEWKAGKLAAAVEGLKEIRTPAPPVPEKDEKEDEGPDEDFIIIQ